MLVLFVFALSTPEVENRIIIIIIIIIITAAAAVMTSRACSDGV